jgi:hypothetical protein
VDINDPLLKLLFLSWVSALMGFILGYNIGKETPREP